MTCLLEFELEDEAGTIFHLAPDTRHALEISGLGMPPVKHWTTRSPFQQGRTHWGYAFQPRIVNLVLITFACDRTALYSRRQANVDMLNPMNGPLKLRLRVADGGLVYELHDGWYQGGYELESTRQALGSGGVWSQVGGVQLEFDDPMWKWVNSSLGVGETRDADGRTCVVDDTWTLAPALVLPFVGPYLLGTTVGTNTLTCTNDGTWATLPVITVEGPIDDWIIRNTTNGYMLMWDGYAIQAGETVTIDIPGKSCTSDITTPPTDVSTYLSGDTGSFALDPGANTLNVYASGGVVNLTTTVSACWYVELLGT